MINLEVCKITDGTEAGTISLVDGVDGLRIRRWDEGVAQDKGGGTWNDSPFADGRRPVDRRYANVVGSIVLSTHGSDQDQADVNLLRLEELLNRAWDYWATGWQDGEVWLEVKAQKETNTRYARIAWGALPGIGTMIDQVEQEVTRAAGQHEQILNIEYEHWSNRIPTGCTEEVTTSLCSPSYLSFDGSGDVVNCGSDATLDDLPDNAVAGKGVICIDGWIRANGYGENNEGRIIVKGSAAYGTSGFHFFITNTDGLRGYINCATTDADSTSGLDEFSADGEWHHVLMCYDETGGATPAARTIYLAIDGVWVASYPTQQVSVGNYASDAADDLLIGNNVTPDRCFNGDIGWLRVSNTIRHTVGTNFVPIPRCSLPTPDANTIGIWIFEGDGTVASNLQGDTNLDGTITGATWGCSCFVVEERDCNCVEASAMQEDWEYEAWAINTNQPVNVTNDMLSLINTPNRIIAIDGGVPQILYTDTGIAPWVIAAASPTDSMFGLYERQSDGYLFSTGTGAVTLVVWRSTDGGNNWTLRTNQHGSNDKNALAFADDGYMYLADHLAALAGFGADGIYRSNDDGATWNLVEPLPEPRSIIYTGEFLLTADGNTNGIYRSYDGLNWAQIAQVASGGIPILYDLGDGYIYLLATQGTRIYRSTNGINWSLLYDFPISPDWLNDITYNEERQRYYVITNNANIYSSTDAQSWVYEVNIGGPQAFSIETYLGNSRVYADNGIGDIYEQSEIVSVGRSATCSDEVFIANKQNRAQLTNVFIYDASGPTYTPRFPSGAFPFLLFPAVAAIGDIAYFCIDSTILDSGPYCSLVFDLYEILTYTTAYTLVWEYWNGAWVTENVNDGTNAFQNFGVNSVNWVPSSDWTTTAVNGVTGYFVRARITNIVGPLTSPSQQRRDVYTVNWPCIDIDGDQLTGNITALLRAMVRNRSDEDAYETIDELDLLANRVLVGLRSLNRGATGGSNFAMYLNCADEQNGLGVTVTAGANSVFGNNIQAPTGREIVHTTTGTSTWTDECTFTLGPTVARDYYGNFHVYFRGKQVDRSAVMGEIKLRVQARTGSGGVLFTSESKPFPNLNDWQLLDFDELLLPVSEALRSSDLPDEMQIVIQVWSSVGSLTVKMYDLELLPVDEWAGDFVDRAFEDDSGVMYHSYLDIDSVKYPKEQLRAPVRSTENDRVQSIYRPQSPSEAVLQENADQRLWFLQARAALTGTHTGANNQTTLTDANASFLTSQVKAGQVIFNVTDGSVGVVGTTVTATTISNCGLTGGVDNDWDTGDIYWIICPNWRSEPWLISSVSLEAALRYLSARGNR